VLAVADGEGRNGTFLASLGADVHAVDFSDMALERAEKLAAEQRVKIMTEQVDLLSHEFADESYDAIVAIFIQFAAPDQRGDLFKNLQNALKPGGLFVLQGYRPEQIEYGTGGPPDRDNMYTEDFLKQTFADFDIEHLQSHDDSIDEGPGHSGMSALIDLVARTPL
jgi:cyclopropane fatty-acyl-phospholipid synthase-like methyltransferase